MQEPEHGGRVRFGVPSFFWKCKVDTNDNHQYCEFRNRSIDQSSSILVSHSRCGNPLPGATALYSCSPCTPWHESEIGKWYAARKSFPSWDATNYRTWIIGLRVNDGAVVLFFFSNVLDALYGGNSNFVYVLVWKRGLPGE